MEKEKKKVAVSSKKEKDSGNCEDPKCPFHGNLKVRKRKVKGYVIRKFQKRIVVEFERLVPVKKYRRYKKARTRLHARLPDCKFENVKVGDYVIVGECRPLSKIIHHVFIRKVKEEEK